MDWPVFALTVIIMCIGLIMVLSASSTRLYYDGDSPIQSFLSQGKFALMGIVGMVIFSRLRVGIFRKYAPHLFGLSVLLLLLVLIIGTVGGGSRRWLRFGSFGMQPSEAAKIALILFYADLICKFGKKRMKSLRHGVLPFVGITAIVVGLLMLEPHLSASMIILCLMVIMLYVGGIRSIWILVGLVAAVGVVFVAAKAFPYVQARLDTMFHPENDAQGDGFQIIQSLLAVGSGGLTGLGLGQSRQKSMFLPEESNDYIFAIVCEELGFIGAALILLLFALLICRCYWIALHANTKFGGLAVVGIASLLAIQVFLNVAVVTKLGPSTGISLPFFSTGGTALIINSCEIGIVLSISRDIALPKEDDE